MGFTNTITVISNDEGLVEQIGSKLVLLRDLDKITNCSFDNAIDFLKNQLPNVIIIHCSNDNPDAIKLIKDIKATSVISQVPVLFLNDNCSRETIIDAFDNDISDILKHPAHDYELLIRTIWCIQKDDLNTSISTQFEFMKTIGMIQPDTGVYTQKYCEEFLKSQIENAISHKINSCLMLVTPDSKYPGYKNPKEFLEVIKKSIRINDSVAIKDVDEFYIFLPKTKLNGVYPVFERINTNLGVDCGANASVIEIKNEKFDSAKEFLQEALNKAKEETNSLIVASSTYSKDPNAGINLAKQPPAQQNKQAEKTHEIAPSDEKTSKLYAQAYKQKCKIVFEPVFEKYYNLISSKIKDVKVKYEVNTDKTRFIIYKNNVRAYLSIMYGGLYKAQINTAITSFDTTKSSNTITLDFVQLNFKKLSQILDELCVEFKNYVKE